MLISLEIFQDSFIEPQFPRIGINIGGGSLKNRFIRYLGKYAEYLMAAIILVGALLGPIQYIMRLYLNTPVKERLPLEIEFISYIPIVLVLFAMSVLFIREQRRNN